MPALGCGSCVSLLTPRGLNRELQKLDRSGYLKGSDLQGSDCNLLQVCDVVWPAGVPMR